MSDELKLRIDHVSLSVEDVERARDFYQQLLAPLGLELVAEYSEDVAGVAVAGFGIGRKGSFWLAESGKQTPQFHGCFRADSRADVRAFHEAGLAAGGEDNGAPGIREIYHPDYYAAFVLDPEGHNIEAVTFEQEKPTNE
jgi:catechol 2,3-dioxygenase-like lactoylglutathione lyase family enzyme